MILDQSIELIKKHEGLRLVPYEDTEGHLTVGYGHNLENSISEAEAETLLRMDLARVERELKIFSWYAALDPVRRAVVENMVFNLGFGGFSLFQKTIAFIEQGKYSEAAEEMLRGSAPDGRSEWYSQVGQRALDLSEMMRSGQFPE